MLGELYAIALVLLMINIFFMIGTQHVHSLIRSIITQGLLIALITAAVQQELDKSFVAVPLAILAMKSGLFGFLLSRAVISCRIPDRLHSSLSSLSSILWCVAVLVLILGIGAGIEHPAAIRFIPGSAAMAAFMLFAGFFLIVTRSTAFVQMAGLITLVNGVFLMGVLTENYENTILVPGLLMDSFVVILLICMIVMRIRERFNDLFHDEEGKS